MFKLSSFYNHTSSKSLSPLCNDFVDDALIDIRPQCVVQLVDYLDFGLVGCSRSVPQIVYRSVSKNAVAGKENS